MTDIFYKNEDWVFSYRVAGIYIKDGKILLQKPENDPAFALPGGHVSFGETNAEALAREMAEETGLDFSVGEMKWVMENFFPWGDKGCHQIGTFFLINTESELQDEFLSAEIRQGGDQVHFYMVPIEDLDKYTVYPTGLKELIADMDSGIKHLIYKEI